MPLVIYGCVMVGKLVKLYILHLLVGGWMDDNDAVIVFCLVVK